MGDDACTAAHDLLMDYFLRKFFSSVSESNLEVCCAHPLLNLYKATSKGLSMLVVKLFTLFFPFLQLKEIMNVQSLPLFLFSILPSF